MEDEKNTSTNTIEKIDIEWTDEQYIEARVKQYRDGAFNHQERRHADWRENYGLYRDKVITNRLTQRQSVNVPLMKESIRTSLSKTDEFTDIYFESLSGDKQKEIFINSYWEYFYKVDNLELKDIVDKKQQCLYGRSTMKLNLVGGRPSAEVLEPYEWLCDRYADPSDIDNTANYQAHIGIFRTLSQIESNPLYDEAKVKQLKELYASQMGLALSEENVRALQAKNERMQDMGLYDINNPELGETYVELNEHYIKLWDDEKERLMITLRVTADNITLISVQLEELLNINFFPFISWADDVEKTDLWSDGMADVVRTPNKILNSFFSQMVENRTLRNFGMHMYDATQGDGEWQPQTYEAVPWGWYPTAGNPNTVTKQIEIPDLSEGIDEMEYIRAMVERATATTATEKGVNENKETTLGQVKLMLQASNERITSTAKFYRLARIEFGEKWYKFVMANAEWIEPVKLYKKSSQGNYFKEEVNVTDWMDDEGYVCKVVSTSERDQKNIEAVQKLQAVAGMFQGNAPLQKILQKKALDLVDLSADEIKEVLDFESKKPVLPAEGTLPDGSVPSPLSPKKAPVPVA